MIATGTKLLLIEDNDGHARLIQRALSRTARSFDVHRACCLAEALELLDRVHPRIVLADLNLPDSTGTQTVAELRQHGCLSALVVLTSLDDDQTAVNALRQGAQDYLIKDRVTPELLERTVRYAIQREDCLAEKAQLLARLQNQQQSLERKNRRLAGLYRTAQRFVDDLSHDFRTPLTVIKEYASLVNDGIVGPVTGEQRRMIDVISDRADDLNRMVDDMLDVSKINSGLMGVYRRACNVADIVRHNWPALERKAALKRVELTVDVPAELPEIYCDDDKIGRVLVNLVVNAIKFCGDPGRVRLSARHDANAQEVVFAITDNGQGIEPDALNRIFRRFNQAGGIVRNSAGGHGLGLSIAKELVSLNLGTIDVESQPGHGSTFSFTVPVVERKNIFRRYLVRLARQKDPPSHVSLMEAEMPPSVPATAGERIDSFLSYLLRRGDLVLRRDERRWLVAVDRPADEAMLFVRRARHARKKANRNCIGELLPSLRWRHRDTWPMDGGLGALEPRIDELFAPTASALA